MCGTPAAGNGSSYSAHLGGICGFAGKEERALDGLGQGLLCRYRSDRDVHIGTAAKRIGAPIVHGPGFQEIVEVPTRNRKHL